MSLTNFPFVYDVPSEYPKHKEAPLGGRPWALTHSGRAFPTLLPTPSDVHWPDVVYALAYTNRFSGHVGEYTVAQHSIFVGDHLPPEIRAYGYLHDAHEFVISDFPAPAMQALERHGYGHSVRVAMRALKDDIDSAIYCAAGLRFPIPDDIKRAVKEADIRAMLTERRDMWDGRPLEYAWDEDLAGYEPYPDTIRPWSHGEAMLRFADALKIHVGIDVGPHNIF